MLNGIIGVKKQYLKIFNFVQQLKYLLYIAIVGTIYLCTKEWIVWNEKIKVNYQYL